MHALSFTSDILYANRIVLNHVSCTDRALPVYTRIDVIDHLHGNRNAGNVKLLKLRFAPKVNFPQIKLLYGMVITYISMDAHNVISNTSVYLPTISYS